MRHSRLFDLIPLWLTLVAMVAIVLLSIYGGLSLAHFRTRGLGMDGEPPVSTVVAAMVALVKLEAQPMIDLQRRITGQMREG